MLTKFLWELSTQLPLCLFLHALLFAEYAIIGTFHSE